MRQHNKYIEALGYDVRKVGINWKPDYHNILRYWERKKQRLECGYDDRITYNLDEWMIEQLYTWLYMYLEASHETIDLDYYKFDFEGMRLTEFEAIVYILDSFKNWLLCIDDLDKFCTEEEDAAVKQVQKAFILLGMIWPALWW